MTHPWQQYWFSDVLPEKYPQCFENIRVLDVGSLDVNGNNRMYFKNCDYTGLDIVEGPNVDVVSPCHKYQADPFDVVISTSMLEHDMFIQLTLKQIYHLTKPGGHIFLSAANGWPIHGTREHTPENSGTATIEEGGWCDYYSNVSWSDIREGFQLPKEKRRWVDRRDGRDILESDSDLFEYYLIETSKRDIRFIGKKI